MMEEGRPNKNMQETGRVEIKNLQTNDSELTLSSFNHIFFDEVPLFFSVMNGFIREIDFLRLFANVRNIGFGIVCF